MENVLMVAAGDFCKDKFLQYYESGLFDYTVAVDGGYDYLHDLNINPDLALGDFDSVKSQPKGVRIATFKSEKDDSDLELALKRVCGFGIKRIAVFGALGRRIDHTLGNIRAAAFASKKCGNVEIVGEHEKIEFLSGEGTWEKDGIDAGTTISLIPILGICSGLFLRGFKYEIDEVVLSHFASLGISNEATGEPILIGLQEGTVAIVINEDV